MPAVAWLRALSAVGTVAEAARLFRGSTPPSRDSAQSPLNYGQDATAQIETRLTNVVVAALKEAFDRDRARLDLERDLHEAERARKIQALRLEWLRQAGAQAAKQTRVDAALCLGVWLVSAAAAVWLAPLSLVAKVLLGCGWAGLGGGATAAFATHQRLDAWMAEAVARVEDQPAVATVDQSPRDLPQLVTQRLFPWLFGGGFLLTALSLLVAF